jgi:hypothetical protein
MPRSLLRAEQIRDLDVVTEEEHTSEINHYYRDLKDVVTYSGHAGEYVVANSNGDGLAFASSASGFVEDLYYNSEVVVSTVASGVSLSEADNAFYFGNPTVSGTWRIVRSIDDLVFERNDGSNWVNKFTISSRGESLLRL